MNLEEAIEAADILCKKLEALSQSYTDFQEDFQTLLERYSWESQALSGNLKEIRDNLGD